MKILKIAAFLSLLGTLPCEAQTTRSGMLGYNTTTFTNCGTNCITGTQLNIWNSTLVNSAGFLQDSNNWTGRNVFNNTLQGAINLVPSAPPSTPANGDLWATGTGIFAQIGGASYNLLSGNTILTPTGVINATNYMSAAQIANGTGRLGTLDVTAAINSCLAAAIAAMENCYLPSGVWLANTGQLVMNYLSTSSVQAVGVTFFGDGPAATVINAVGNTTAPILLLTAGNASSLGSVSIVYGGVRDLSIQANVAGPVFQVGQNTFYDYMNQEVFSNILIQNYNTTSASTCYRFNAVFSAYGVSLNCASAAGIAGGNDLYQFEKVGYGVWNIGGSNGKNLIHLTNDYNIFNQFNTIDCEIVVNCVLVDGVNPASNSWYGGNWSYSTNGVAGTAGGNNNIFTPGINSIQPFFGSGASASFAKWDNTSLTPLTSPIFSGGVTLATSAGANAIYSAFSGSYISQWFEDSSGNAHLSNLNPAGFLILSQTGAGDIQFSVNGVDVGDVTSTTFQSKVPFSTTGSNGITSAGTLTASGAFTVNGAISTTGTTPTCGANCASIMGNSTNTKLGVNSNAGVTSVTVNFTAAFWTSTPFCVAVSSTASINAAITAVSTSSITFGFPSSTTTTVYAHCME